MKRKFYAVFEKDNETGMIMAFIPELPKAFTVGETIEEARQKLKEVLELVLEEMNSTDVTEVELISVERVEVDL